MVGFYDEALATLQMMHAKWPDKPRKEIRQYLIAALELYNDGAEEHRNEAGERYWNGIPGKK